MSVITPTAGTDDIGERRAAWLLLLNVAHAIDHWVLLIFPLRSVRSRWISALSAGKT